MGNIPVLKPREVVALLEMLGFIEIRQRGSHKQFRHPDGRCTTVPFHAGPSFHQFYFAKSLKILV
ncbi:type II toxin-antitoxin system HicA family toxin [Methylomonas paludis]|uniref:Type II toxin-antitoxin system HicA family toxin n=1 Tax=Methylomonas paludis TaxID=1173101 RepID=A0A975MQX7_9GAMM|nr:type II toxin-antitoxin system HicA family toxin [Methylomonas paludis]